MLLGRLAAQCLALAIVLNNMRYPRWVAHFSLVTPRFPQCTHQQFFPVHQVALRRF